MNDYVNQERVLAKLHAILHEVADGKISVKFFCEEYEKFYNFELEKKNLPKNDGQILRDLFNKVVWFSPFTEERKKISRYLGEAEIIKAVEVVILMLSQKAN